MFTFCKAGLKGEQTEKGVGQLQSVLEPQDNFKF